ncbi:MAG: GntR family transcriptional regulator [Planctomycetota bacterium]
MIAPKTVREQVTTRLRGELMTGAFTSGDPLREIELASRLGVSRGPVRDALMQLTQEGWLAYQANRGVTVRHPPREEHRAFIVSLRVQIESFVVKSALKSITDEGLAAIEASLMQLKTACILKDPAEIALADMAFHEAIVTHCDGEDLLSAWRQLCTKMLIAYSRLENIDDVYKEHEVILEAIKARNVKKTIAGLESNIQ